MADIAVIIVNYNAADLALRAVESALAQDRVETEIHLVDNASPGGDAERLAAEIAARGWEGCVTLYAEAENHGFGRGNNLVLERLAARPDAPPFAMFLNPDASARSDAFCALKRRLEAEPRAAVAGAAIVGPDGAPQASAFRFHSIASAFEAAAAFGPVSRALARWRVPLETPAEARPVDWVSGAAFLARRAALEEVGGFDPGYFLYFEETDMMRALRRRGWQCWIEPAALVEHDEGGATGLAAARRRRARAPAYWYESWRRYFAKNHGRAYALSAAGAWAAGAALGAAAARLRGRPAPAPRALFRDLAGKVILPLLRGET